LAAALAAIAAAHGGCGGTPNPPPAPPAPPVPPPALLIDDFSNVDAFTTAGNPYAADASPPLWLAEPQAPAMDPAERPLHTNTLGWLTGWRQPAPGAASSATMADAGGSLVLTWTGRPGAWETRLAGAGAGRDASAFTHLSLRIKGQTGREALAVRVEAGPAVSTALPLARYAQLRAHVAGVLGAGDWQTVAIPLADFGVDLRGLSAILLEPEPPEAGAATIHLDDLMLVADPERRPPFHPGKPPSTGPVQIRGRQLLVDGRPWLIRGAGYSPTPIGQTPEWGPFAPYTPQTLGRDAPLMASAGINTVRTWGRIERALIEHGARPHGLHVCAGFWVPYTISFANEWATARLAREFRDYVAAYRDDPEILLWVIGNENNLHNGYDWRWYRFADRLAQIAYEVEGAGYRPVAVVEAASTAWGDAAVATDRDLPHVDVLGVNMYLGKQWPAIEGFFERLRAKTGKALWIAEYGVDAWYTHDRHNPSDGVEAQAFQADYDLKAWLEIVRQRDRGAIGATVMEYSDEWWKDHTVPAEDLGAHLRVHDHGGWDDSLDEPHALPDQFKNEEWWGLVAVAPAAAPGQPDTVHPRQAFAELYAPALGGRVLDADGQGAPDRRVVLLDSGGVMLAAAETDAEGLYAFARLRPGAYRVRLEPEAAERRATLTPAEPTAVVDLP
jgi:hypothetical protein